MRNVDRHVKPQKLNKPPAGVSLASQNCTLKHKTEQLP